MARRCTRVAPRPNRKKLETAQLPGPDPSERPLQRFYTTKTQSGHWPDRNPAAQHTLADLLWREEVVQTLQLRDNKWRQVKMDISRQASVRSFFRACPSGRQPLRVLAPYPSRFRCRANRNTQLSDQKCRWGRLGPIIEASRRREADAEATDNPYHPASRGLR
jgi:hypothetical protein